MWIGELITERGIGNGISFIIFAGIVSRAPGALNAFRLNPNIALAIAFAVVAVVAVGVIIYIQEGQRRIPIQYASRVRGRRMYSGGQTFLPLRVNQAGVIPIIFAVSILLFPHQLATYFSTSNIPIVKQISEFIVTIFSNTSPFYIVTYFLLTMGFTYFYTAFTFKPDETAEQLRKNGGFIPGIRPGRPTQEYLPRVVTRITFAGALFLAIVAVSPSVIAPRDPRPGHARPGRHEPADRRLGRGRDDEADRSPADDEELRRIHPMSRGERRRWRRPRSRSGASAPCSARPRRDARAGRRCRQAVDDRHRPAWGSRGGEGHPGARRWRSASASRSLRRATSCARPSPNARRSGARPIAT